MEAKQKSFLEQISQIVVTSDVINIVFVLFLFALTLIFFNRVDNPLMLIALYTSMLTTAALLIWFVRSRSRPILYFLRRWYPLAFVLITFFSLGSIVHYVLPHDIDKQLMDLDLAIFGVHPTVFLSPFMNPYVVDILELCYASFYFLPVILGFFLYFKGKEREFETFVIIICLGFFISDIGNILFPAKGPSQTMTALHMIPLEGKWIGSSLRALIFALEPYRWDCFPSGHVAVTALTLALAYRFERRLFWFILPIGTCLIFSTIYLRYHYVVDLLAGALLAAFLFVGNGIVQWIAVKARQAKLKDLAALQVYSIDKDIS
jgi:membrane-associated phospholipid phosphatase